MQSLTFLLALEKILEEVHRQDVVRGQIRTAVDRKEGVHLALTLELSCELLGRNLRTRNMVRLILRDLLIVHFHFENR